MNALLPSGPLELPGREHPQHAVWALLESVCDPEIPMVSLREMGVLREIRSAPEGGLELVITPTYSGCPAMDQMRDDLDAALRAAGLSGRVQTVLAPAWSSDWLTPSARDKLRQWGIAPPACGAEQPIHFSRRAAPPAPAVPCPRCGSTDTTETSRFGSTACKALYRCLNCSEPFDHFKPY